MKCLRLSGVLLKKIGVEKSKADPFDGKDTLILYVYVGDLIVAARDKETSDAFL